MKKRTLAETDAIVKSNTAVMESTATRLESLGRAMHAIIGPTKAVSALQGMANDLRENARHSMAKLA